MGLPYWHRKTNTFWGFLARSTRARAVTNLRVLRVVSQKSARHGVCPFDIGTIRYWPRCNAASSSCIPPGAKCDLGAGAWPRALQRSGGTLALENAGVEGGDDLAGGHHRGIHRYPPRDLGPKTLPQSQQLHMRAGGRCHEAHARGEEEGGRFGAPLSPWQSWTRPRRGS